MATPISRFDRAVLERAYEDRWLAVRHEFLAIVCMALGIFLHVGCLLFEPLVQQHFPLTMGLMFHAVCIAFIAAWALFHRRTRFTMADGVYANMTFAMAGFAYLTWRFAVQTGDSLVILVMTSTYLLLCNFTTFLTPFHGKRVPVSAVFYWLMAVAACGGITLQSARWLGFTGMSMVFALIFQRAQIKQTRRLARLALESRILLAPVPVVLGAVGGSLESAFAPRLRRCVCVSSDWRNYQAMAAAMPSGDLAAVLDRYYSEVERILINLVPSGNYILDWIADELFVAFYADSEADDDRLIDLGIGFGRRLLLFKEAFYAEHQLPKSIDVGIGTGEALVGMMGPTGFRKAAVIGACAEGARRVQAEAKILRKDFGDRDRVVFDEAVYREIRAMPGGALERFTPDPGSGLGTKLHYYYEPAA